MILALLALAGVPAGLREPVALAATPDAVVVACADGTLFTVQGEAVVRESGIARSLADLVALDDETLVATDPVAGEVLVVRGDHVVARHAVPDATTVVTAGRQIVVASTWARTLTRLPGDVLDLPFSPRSMAASGDTLVVADAFGGHLAVVDLDRWSVLESRELPAHNIRAVRFVDEGRVLLAHQILDPLANVSFDDLHWGNLVRNVLREVALDGLETTRLVHLGDVGRGAADPSSLAFEATGRPVVALAGTDELLVGDTRHPVGRRPVAVLALEGGFVVANALDDTLSFVVDGRVRTVPLGERRALSLAERGKRLFFDARLAHDRWMSCHSCHTDGHTSGRLADTLGDDTYDTPKRVLSLLGVRDTAPYAWTGTQPTLEAQIDKTLRTTMHAESFDEDTVAALAAYLRSLSPPPPLPASERGRALFVSAGCVDCHAAPAFTSPDAFDVGIVDETGHGTFNPPSLRGVRFRERLLHDGRYTSIEEMLAKAGHPGAEKLGVSGIADVAAYLRTL